MKKIWNLTLLVMVTSSSSFSQFNLVPNPSFEVFDTCPDFSGQIRYAIPWSNPLVGSTPDYFNACDTAGLHYANVPDNFMCYQNARTGVAMATVVTACFPANHAAWNYREYIQVELSDSLLAGEDYCIQFYVSPCDSCHYISNNIGIHFSNVAFSDTCPGCPMPLPLIPQFENPVTNYLDNRFGWNEITGTYTAMGGEKFIIIGNFHDTASTVVAYTGWSNPLTNGFNVAYYFIDDILLVPCDSLTGIDDKEINNDINIYPNPFASSFSVESNKKKINKIIVFNTYGKEIFKSSYNSLLNVTINLAGEKDGLFYVQIFSDNSITNFKLIKNK